MPPGAASGSPLHRSAGSPAADHSRPTGHAFGATGTMRVCIDARNVKGVPTGLGRYALNLVRHIARIDRSTDYLLLRHADYGRPLVRQENFSEVVLSYENSAPRNILLGALRINELEVDLYHTLFHMIPFGLRVPRLVVTLHDLIWVRHIDLAYHSGWERRFMGAVAEPLIGRALEAADRIVAISDATRREAIDHYGLAPERFTVIGHGVDPTFFDDGTADPGGGASASDPDPWSAPSGTDPDALPPYGGDGEPEEARSGPRSGLPAGVGGRPFVFCLGHSKPYKNVVRLLEAFARVAGDHPEVALLVAGRGEGYEVLRSHVEDLGLEDRVVLSPPVGEQTLKRCLDQALCLAFPSLVEGFGLPVLEAMARGCPVLTSDVPPMSETAGDAAVTADPTKVESLAGGLARLISDPRLREELARRGRERARRFTWEAAARATVELYRETVTKVPPARPGGGR